MGAARHQTGKVRHVDHEDGADFIGDLAESGEVELAGIGAAAGQDQLGLVLAGQRGNLVHVDMLVVLAHRVGHRLEPLARIVGRVAMGEMAARRQIEPHERVAGLQQRIEHRLVGIGARMRLHVGEAAIKQLAGAFDGELLGDVDIFAAAVIALAGIAFGILVGQDRPLGFQHRLGDDVLGGDQFDLVTLAVQFVLDAGENGRIGALQIAGEKAGVTVHGIGGSRHAGSSLQLELVEGRL